MASPAQNFTRRVYHGDGAPLPTGLTLIAYAFAIATLFAVAMMIGPGRLEGALAEVLGLGVLPLVIARLHRVPFAQLGLVAPRPLAVVGAVIAGAGLWLIALAAATPIVQATHRHEAVHELTTTLFGGQPNLALLVLTLVVVPAVCEELTHRGLLLGGLAPGLGRALAIAISTGLFAILHVEPARMVSTAILGVAAGLCALWSGSLWPAIALHATNNLVVMVVGVGLAPRLSALIDREATWSLPLAGALAVLGLMWVWRSGPRA